jgi:hypothetical protein
MFQVKERFPVLEAYRKDLLSIPGHATNYEKRTKELRDAYFNAPDSAKLGTLASKLSRYRMYHFQRLEVMPSPEAVRVLGDFLYDDRGSVSGTRGYHIDHHPYRSIGSSSQYALRALAVLPIEFKPLQPRKGNFVINEQDIDAWRLWYEQIKAGTRTFRFEGDPQNYSLAGPVAEEKTPRQGGRGFARSLIYSQIKTDVSESLEKQATGISLILLQVSIFGFAVACILVGLRKRKRVRSA